MRHGVIGGVIGLLAVVVTPFLFVAEAQERPQSRQSPVEVESLTEPGGKPPTSRDREGNANMQRDVRPASPEEIPFQPPIEEEQSAGGTPAAFDTQYRLQLLQQEVQELRGLVEELTYQLRRMQSTQEDRYLELDSRFQNLQSQINRGSVPGTGAAGTGGSDAIANVDDEDIPVVAGSGDERELYETSLELIRNRQYNSAIGQLRALIDQFPDGDFTANAYYWLGEVYAAKPDPDYEPARQALSQVIEFFPEHRKVPDAAFKLGKVHHLMGNCEEARQRLEQVRNDYPGKSVANLADAYLRDKVDCGG